MWLQLIHKHTYHAVKCCLTDFRNTRLSNCWLYINTIWRKITRLNKDNPVWPRTNAPSFLKLNISAFKAAKSSKLQAAPNRTDKLSLTFLLLYFSKTEFSVKPRVGWNPVAEHAYLLQQGLHSPALTPVRWAAHQVGTPGSRPRTSLPSWTPSKPPQSIHSTCFPSASHS